jgi:hypothetical protein
MNSEWFLFAIYFGVTIGLSMVIGIACAVELLRRRGWFQ